MQKSKASCRVTADHPRVKLSLNPNSNLHSHQLYDGTSRKRTSRANRNFVIQWSQSYPLRLALFLPWRSERVESRAELPSAGGRSTT